jgi:hypothetical protein
MSKSAAFPAVASRDEAEKESVAIAAVASPKNAREARLALFRTDFKNLRFTTSYTLRANVEARALTASRPAEAPHTPPAP